MNSSGPISNLIKFIDIQYVPQGNCSRIKWILPIHHDFHDWILTIRLNYNAFNMCKIPHVCMIDFTYQLLVLLFEENSIFLCAHTLTLTRVHSNRTSLTHCLHIKFRFPTGCDIFLISIQNLSNFVLNIVALLIIRDDCPIFGYSPVL